MSERGKYIVIEGTDATGKSFHASLLRSRLAKRGIKTANFIVEEPDSAIKLNDVSQYDIPYLTEADRELRMLVPAASAIRKIVKSREMNCSTEANILLFTASRQLNWQQAMLPALQRGETVVTARNWLSTLVYQGYAEGGDIAEIESLTKKYVGEEYMKPDMQLILDMSSEEERQLRLNNRGTETKADAFEQRPPDFQQKVILGYRAIAAERNIPLLSATPEETTDDVHQRIRNYISKTRLFPELFFR
ncbi:MAG: hypothetical protein WAQ25_03155 [Candidatus Saccharimonas sp.]